MIAWIGNAGAAAGAAAAAAQMQRLREEEELLATIPSDGYGAFEYKIVRCQFNAFDKPAKLRQTLEEEAKAGWELVEKFDANRIRLRRPVSCRAQDDLLDFNPYRSQVGMSDTKLALTIVGAIVGVMLLVAMLVVLIKNNP